MGGRPIFSSSTKGRLDHVTLDEMHRQTGGVRSLSKNVQASPFVIPILFYFTLRVSTSRNRKGLGKVCFLADARFLYGFVRNEYRNEKR